MCGQPKQPCIEYEVRDEGVFYRGLWRRGLWRPSLEYNLSESSLDALRRHAADGRSLVTDKRTPPRPVTDKRTPPRPTVTYRERLDGVWTFERSDRPALVVVTDYGATDIFGARAVLDASAEQTIREAWTGHDVVFVPLPDDVRMIQKGARYVSLANGGHVRNLRLVTDSHLENILAICSTGKRANGTDVDLSTADRKFSCANARAEQSRRALERDDLAKNGAIDDVPPNAEPAPLTREQLQAVALAMPELFAHVVNYDFVPGTPGRSDGVTFAETMELIALAQGVVTRTLARKTLPEQHRDKVEAMRNVLLRLDAILREDLSANIREIDRGDA